MDMPWGWVLGAALVAAGCNTDGNRDNGRTEATAAAAPAAPTPAQPKALPMIPTMDDITAKVAADAVVQYEMTQRNGGTPIDLCVQAGLVSASYLQAKNEPEFKKWKATEKANCAAAGMPQ
jgi:hypothetical protein